ncbi:MAG: hypothetical protein KA408_05560 [Flavobacteriales bacterium]|nr:hypothetical protein [Flavobacteriales bacterium]
MPSIFLSSDTSVTATAAALKLPKPEVRVEFRPASDYDGDHGFDWVRRGDTSLLGDKDYADIIGSCTGGSFVADIDEKQLKKYYKEYCDSNSAVPKIMEEDYPVAVLALFKDKKAKVSLKVNIKKSPDELKFKYNEQALELTKNKLDNVSVGEQDLKDFLSISFKDGRASSQIEFVEVYADDELAGQLRVLPNDTKHTYLVDVVFIYVKTDIGNGSIKEGKHMANEVDSFNKTFRQSLSDPQVTKVNWDLRKNEKFNTDLVLDDDGNKIIKKGDELFNFLESEFSKEHSQYDDNYKVFIFDDRGGRKKADGSIKGLGGAMQIGGKIGFVFSSRKLTTLPHEFLHGLGLRHTFDCAEKYQFEKLKTANIMDYTQNRQYTWHWQWKKLWPKFKKISEV